MAAQPSLDEFDSLLPLAPAPRGTLERALRVLLADASDRGGIARYTQCLRAALVAEHAEVALAAPAGVGDPELLLRRSRWGPDVVRMKKPRLYALRLGELAPSIVGLVRAVRRAHPSVVHVQTEVVHGLEPLVLRQISRRTPVILTIHDPLPLEGGARAVADQARRWRAADALIIHGEEPRCFVEASAPGVPVHVVPVDLRLGGPSIPKRQARNDLGLDDVPMALLLGQVRSYKGIGLLARSWPRVVAALPEARLLVVGEAYDSADLSMLQGCSGVEVRRGFVEEADLDRWASAADVLVLPYAVGSHSGVLHRGLAAGTPVLASPPLAEEVYRTGAGIIVPLDPKAWADALVSSLGAHPLPRPSPPTGRGTALGTLAVYRKVLAERTQRGE
ncbi:MAG TPA: glycosyltransferase [Acidimicrobiales bacterium]|nr:glycosyltransferase [Acidimicrobiales bacterium]